MSPLFTWAEGFRLVGGGVDLTGRALREAVEARVDGPWPCVAGGALAPLVLDSDPGGILTLLAAWQAGIVPAPLNPRLTEPERALARARLTGSPEGTLAVLWTSGTAGRPRGVALGGRGFEAHVRAASDRLGLDGSEAWLASLSLAHVGGLALVARAASTGATLIAPGSGDARTVVDALRGIGSEGRRVPPATHLSLVPTQLDRVLELWGEEPPPPTVRCILVGGAHAPADLVQRAVGAGWPVALTYGMTEMWSQVATAPPELVRTHPGTVGRPLPATEVRIAPDGEILVRGPSQALGYLASEGGGDDGQDGTAALTPLADPDGWYRTGDLGRLDEAGFLRITGRRSDRIVTGGVNVDPAEVEDVLRGHPSVLDAGVAGVPSAAWGETVAAMVVLAEGPTSLGLPELEAWIRERLAGPKRPRVWKVARTLPRNANGKLDRQALVRLLTDGG